MFGCDYGVFGMALEPNSSLELIGASQTPQLQKNVTLWSFWSSSSFLWSTSFAAPNPLKIEVHMELKGNYPQFPLQSPNRYFLSPFLPAPSRETPRTVASRRSRTGARCPRATRPPPACPSDGGCRPLPSRRPSPPIAAPPFSSILASRASIPSPPLLLHPNPNPRGPGEGRRFPAT
jgi:hypothetical protein